MFLTWCKSRRHAISTRFRLLALFALAVGIAPQTTYALPTYPPIALATYHPKLDSSVAKAINSCQFCHTSGGPPNLNPYGKDLKAALIAANTKELTPAILRSIENKDSDGDGFPNGVELAADKLPGDPTSKPDGVPVRPVSAVKSGESGEPDPLSAREIFLPKHAQHPVIVHFPIALFMISLLFDVLGYRKRNPALTSAGFLNLGVAAASGPFCIATGLLAWRSAYGGVALQGFLLYHLILGVVTTVLLATLWGIRRKQQGALTGKWGRVYFALSALTLMVIIVTGHLGGTLVYGR